jgi:hypothetical protein
MDTKRSSKAIEDLVERSVVSSCGVEGIRVDFKKIALVKLPKQRDKKIYKTAK